VDVVASYLKGIDEDVVEQGTAPALQLCYSMNKELLQTELGVIRAASPPRYLCDELVSNRIQCRSIVSQKTSSVLLLAAVSEI
jgi:hypothetical protein